MISSRSIFKAYRKGINTVIYRVIPKRSVVLLDKSQNFANITAGLEELSQTNSDKRSMSVTKFITQYNELRQINDVVSGVKRTSPEMTKGDLLHKRLEILCDAILPPFPELVDVRGDISEYDQRFLFFWHKFSFLSDTFNSYSQNQDMQQIVPIDIRELFLFGKTPINPSWHLRGIIDCVRLTPHGLVVLEIKTTNHDVVTGEQLRLAYHQAMTYHYMLKQILELANIDSEKCVTTLLEVFNVTNESIRSGFLECYGRIYSTIQSLAKVGMDSKVQIEVVYMNRKVRDMDTGFKHEKGRKYKSVYESEIYEINYDERILMQVFQSRTDLFLGNRKPYSFSLKDLHLSVTITETNNIHAVEQNQDNLLNVEDSQPTYEGCTNRMYIKDWINDAKGLLRGEIVQK